MRRHSDDSVVAPAERSKASMLALRAILLTTVSLFLVACASSSTVNQAKDDSGVPLWVNEGSSIFTSKEGRRFHGVGSAPDLGDFSLQTSTADNRARQEITRILASYLEIVSRDFIATGDAEEVGFTEQTVAIQMDSVSSIDLTGIEVVGHWRDENSKVIYSIATVDMQKVREVLNKTADLNSGLRNFISDQGNRIFDRIAISEGVVGGVAGGYESDD